MMLKILLLVAVVLVAVWALIGRSRRPDGSDRKAPQGTDRATARRTASPQQMVTCAHCSVHLPATDAVTDGERHYCSAEHRAAAGRF